MDRINELRQKAIEARAHAGDYRLKAERAVRLGQPLNAADEKAYAEAVQMEDETSQAFRREEAKLAAEDERLAARRRATGRNSLGEPVSATGAEDDEPAAIALPALPARTRAAISRLYPHASSDPEQRAESWRGVVAAALGGQPMHPSVLAATATEGVPSDGGFMVGTEVAAGIFQRAAEGSVWLRIGARFEPMTTSEKIVNAVDDDDETDDAEATLKAEWKGEEDEADAQVMTVRQVTLHARKLLVLAAASNELAEDAPAYVEALEAALGRAIGKKLDRAILSGSGAGQPLGVLNAPATITVAAEGGQAADSFLWENAVAMWAALAPGSHESAWWLIHPQVLPQALSMTMAAGTGGFQPRGAFESGGPTGYRLLGRPVLVTSRVKPLGNVGDVILVDPSQLAVGVRRGLAIERSSHAFFSSDRLAIRGRFRGDARPMWEKARTLADSGGTVSPYVVLAAR